MDKNKAPRVTVVRAARARGLGRAMVSHSGKPIADVVDVVPMSKAPPMRPWEATGSIEVEQLAIWAFRDQKADRFASLGLFAIEAQAEGLQVGGRSGDGCGALAEIENLGCRIDRQSGAIRDIVHPAAEAVAVAVHEIEDGEMVRFHASLGGRPDGWKDPVRWYRPVVWIKYGEEGQWERTGRGTSPRFTRIIPTVTRSELARRRITYLRWWEALDRLHWQLSMRALGFTVLPPAAPVAPWEGEGAA